MKKSSFYSTLRPRLFAGLLAPVISAVALFPLTWSAGGTGFILGWNPNPTNEQVTSYMVTVFRNQPTNKWTNIVVGTKVTETNVIRVGYHDPPPSPPIMRFKLVTNVVTRLPTCAVVTNASTNDVYWAYVQADSYGLKSEPSQTLVIFWPWDEQEVGSQVVFTNSQIHLRVPVESGWHYYLKSSHGTPRGAIDHCCGTFVTNNNTVHWNRMSDGDYLGVAPTNRSRLSVVIPTDNGLRHQLYRVFRGHAVGQLTNSTKPSTLSYHE